MHLFGYAKDKIVGCMHFDFHPLRREISLDIDEALIRKVRVTELTFEKNGLSMDLTVDRCDPNAIYDCINGHSYIESAELTKATLALELKIGRQEPKFVGIHFENIKTIYLKTNHSVERWLCYAQLERWKLMCEGEESRVWNN